MPEAPINAPQRPEHEVREKRALMRALLDASGESVLLLAPDGGILAINTLGASRFGETPEAMMGKNFLSYLPPELAADRRALLTHVAATGEPIHSQDQRQGTFFENSLYPVKDATGRVESIAVYAKDVTEAHRNKRVEEIFRHLSTMLLKWQMSVEAIAQIFCDEILPVFGLAAAWIGRVEKNGRLAVLASAEADENERQQLKATELQWSREAACCLPMEEVIKSGRCQKLKFDHPACCDCAAAKAATATGAQAALLLPLRLRNETWGVFTLYGPDPGLFESTQQHRLATIAFRLGAVLESAIQQEWLTLLESALAGVSNAVMITDADARIVWANDALAKLSGYTAEEIIGKTPRLFSSDAQNADFYRRFWETIRAGQTWRGEIVNARRDGSRYTANQTVTPLLAVNGQISHFVAIAEDISERKAMEERIRHAATFDPLTNLPNRSLFFDRLRQTLALARRDGETGALLFLDLDHFKAVNDRFGHAAGDQLLIAVAERLRAQVRESDTVARLAGDEFTVILPRLGAPDGAYRVAEKILAAVSQPLVIADQEVPVGVSIGIALFPEHGDTAEQVLNAADHAMYRAKQAGKNGIRIARKKP